MKLRSIGLAGALALFAASAAVAQTPVRPAAMDLLNARSASYVSAARAGGGDTLSYVSLRGGGMIAPRGGGLVGGDILLTNLSLGNGWHGRLDADVIFKANFRGVNTIVPVTFDQLYYSPGGAGGHNIYYGGGLGAVLGGPGVFDAKLILGTELASRVGAEANVHFTEHDTLLTVLARLHL